MSKAPQVGRSVLGASGPVLSNRPGGKALRPMPDHWPRARCERHGGRVEVNLSTDSQ